MVFSEKCQKKPPRGELTAAEKGANRRLARIRVNVEHALAGVHTNALVLKIRRASTGLTSILVLHKS